MGCRCCTSPWDPFTIPLGPRALGNGSSSGCICLPFEVQSEPRSFIYRVQSRPLLFNPRATFLPAVSRGGITLLLLLGPQSSQSRAWPATAP